MSKQVFKFQWYCTRSGATDTTKHLFASWRQAGEYAAAQERNDKVWRCVGIERED